MSTDANVALLLRGFEYVRDGDLERMAAMWSDDVVYYAFDAHGHAAEYSGPEEALQIALAGQSLMGPHSYELLDVRAVGSELVIVQARIHATRQDSGEPLEGDYVGVFRVRDDKIVACCDFIDGVTQSVLDGAWSRSQ